MAEGFRHIIRICGTDIDGSKQLVYALSQIRGVGVTFAQAITRKLQLDPDMHLGMLPDEDVQKIESLMSKPETIGLPFFLYNRRRDLESGQDKHLLGAELDLRKKMDIDFMRSLKTWKGVRHSLSLKVRGQKTRTTGRSGKAVGVHKKALATAAKASSSRE